MKRIVPSRATLRYLHHLCGADSLNVTTPSLRKCSAVLLQRQTLLQSRRAFSTSQHLPQLPSPSSTTSQPETSPPREDDATALPTSLPDISTFYTLFPTTLPNGPPPASSFSIPLSLLKREFLQLQGRFHPDKFSTSSTAHQKAVALSSLINNAYRTLADPLLRAQYLLEQTYNIDVMSEDNSEHPTDQTTLIDVMEAQESVEEAQNQEEVDRLKAENRARIDGTIAKMGEAFEKGSQGEATQECVRLKYWRSLQQGLDDWEPGKEIRLIH